MIELPKEVAAEPPESVARRERSQRKTASIVPERNVVGNALVFVIAIMTFLSCLTLGRGDFGARHGIGVGKPDRP